MEIYERINELLIIKKMTKREFARKLINLQPISNRTGEVISESIIYSYLSGDTAIKAYLIPYISDVLNVSIECLFRDVKASELEENNLHRNIIELIPYAPEPMLLKIRRALDEIKKINDGFRLN
jgi:transcriptional regulator with XRE-family HTH domain